MKMVLFGFLLAASCSSSKPAPASAQVPVAAAAPAAAAEPAMIPVGTKMRCPVSGEDFTVDGKTTQIVYAGKRYAFCCPDCLPQFNKNPAKFARN